MTDVASPIMVLAVLFVLAQLINSASSLTTIRRNTARTPPLDQEIYQNFATKAEVSRLEGKVDALISSSNDSLRDMTKSIAELTGVVREHLRKHDT